ncbi:MAG: four helix bundle protein [Cyclobacteriaceae bacterium]|nr:four helix bundle protein [Cyclobacteriaceae bacterium]
MRNYNNNTIVKMTFQFALDITDFSEKLRDRKRFVFADQVLRSGCSIGANVKESQGAESKADFIHKMKIATKEAEECEYWLELCEFAKDYPKPGKLLQDIESILKVLNKIISTSKNSIKKSVN